MVHMSEVEEMESADEELEEEEDELGDMFSNGIDSSKRKLSDDENEQGLKSNAAKKKRKLRKENEMQKLNKPPTVEELNRLRETENLFHSNLFRRQIEEMLKELELKNKHRVRINTWVEKFKDWVLKTEDSEDKHDLADLSWLKNRKFKLPLTQFGKMSKGHYSFKRPSNIKIIGSYGTKTMLGHNNVNIAVEMPESFFEKEDYLNGRYYIKRAIYLCDLVEHIMVMTDLVQETKFKVDDGDNWRPVVEITPAGKLNTKLKFVVHVVPSRSSFRLNRFIPVRNNVRPSWLLDKHLSLDDKDCPTAEYNSGILRDLRCLENEDFISEVLGKNPQLVDAVVLLKVWSKQRELNLGFGGFTGHLWSMLIAYLMHVRKLGAVTSSYKVVRTVWNYLVSADWSKNGITLCDTTVNLQPTLSDFHENFAVVFVDSSGFLNLCAGMDPAIFQRCQDEAGLALRSLDTPDINCFQVLFMTPAPFSRLCDHVIVFHNWNALRKIVSEHSNAKEKLNFCDMIYPQAKNLLTSLLKKGWDERVRRVYVKQNPAKLWRVDKKAQESSLLSIGIILDPEHCYSVVDKGPIDDQQKSQEFRKFWGKRSELRRFKDGSITESVVWEAKTWREKRMICRQVAHYLLVSTFKLSLSDFHYVGDELEAVLPANRESQTGEITIALDELIKTLRGLDDLPLNIISVQGASAVFRSCDVFPPGLPEEAEKKTSVNGNCVIVNSDASHAPNWCPTAEVVIQLGSSNKWPRDLDAVRRVRAAFNLKISELLTKNCGIITQAYQDWVDVLTTKCVFRLRIIYPGEIALMKKGVSPDGVLIYRDTAESLLLEKKGVHLPKLTSALNGLQSQFSAYGTTCCLAKRWVRSHLFHPVHVIDEAVDLLVASVFVNPDPWRPPNQPQVAFLRFLSLLATTNWNIEFILLNFNQVLTGDEKHEIESHFDNQRSSLPCLFIATPDDRTRSVWTADGPSPVILLRLCKIAQQTLQILECQLFDKAKPEIMPVFKPSLPVFDVIINLVPGFVPKHHQSLSIMHAGETKTVETLKRIPVVDFDPVECYLHNLRESYGEWALFFYDIYGGTTIGVIWKPKFQQTREFKVSHLNGRQWDRKTNTLHLNIDAIMEGIHVTGEGIVKSVQIKKDDRGQLHGLILWPKQKVVANAGDAATCD